jgi:cysteine desulfurase/selenocysteine lyase
MNLSNNNGIRQQFPFYQLNPDYVYLDSAATSHKPESVFLAITDYYSQYNSNVHRGIYDLSERATQTYEDARGKVKEFINAKESNEIIFTSGATLSANMVAQSYFLYGPNKLTSKDIVLSSIAEHHSNFLPVQWVCKQTGAKVIQVNLTDELQVNLTDLEQLLMRHGSEVKALAFSWVNNVTGNILPLNAILHLKQRYAPKALLVIDASQAIGHLDVDVQKYDVDFLFFSGHKFFAETGIGVLYAKAQLLNEMPPFLLGGGMIEEVKWENVSFAPIPEKHEAGTPNISGAISLGAAVDWFRSLDQSMVKTNMLELQKYFVEKISAVDKLHLLGVKDDEHRIPLFSMYFEHIHAHDVADYLAERKIAVRAGHHCNQMLHRELLHIPASFRASLHIYNTKEDIDWLQTALIKCSEYYSK